MLLRQQGRSLVVHAPAKLNLFLEVLGKRTDGYHELETLMVTVGLHDTLSFTEESSRTIQLYCFDAGFSRGTDDAEEDQVPGGRNNLVVQAANLLNKVTGIDRGVRIDLLKRIPVAAGLAGGSSDAAATLVALSRFWKLNLSANELRQLASKLGSDVSFFLGTAGAAICRGRGEKVEPLLVPNRLHFVIARPKTGLSTARVYRHCRPEKNLHGVSALVDSLKHGRLKWVARHLRNSLQSPAEQLNPEVRRLKEIFSKQPVLGHLMSGSGTAYFGLCVNGRHARAVAARLRAAGVAYVAVAESRM